MLSLIHKSLRFLAFGFLLFAGATDLFSVDLDKDGDVDTDAVVAFDQAAALRRSIPTIQKQKSAEVHRALRPATQAQLLILTPVSQPAPELSLGSPQLLVPLRT
jgi:parvulin-like peptidyl-prolyl isomerase